MDPGNMRLLLVLLLATGTTAFMSVNFQDSGVLETGRLPYKGVHLRSFKVDETEVLEPYIALKASERAKVRKTPVGKGYYFSVPLAVDTKVNASRSGRPSFSVMQITSVSVRLRKNLMGQCGKDCTELTVTSLRKQDELAVIFRCLSRSVCQRIFNALHFSTANSDFIRAALVFTFYGVSNGRSLRLTKAWVPVVKSSQRPFPDSLWFEGDKLLLFTIKAGAGESAYESFMSERRFSIPTDGSLPLVYRSELLEKLPTVLATRSGDWEMVAEMRTGDTRVAQIVFDVSRNRDSVDKTNWFSNDRVKSSYPFWVGRSNFNFFSLDGDAKYGRRFFTNNKYFGCPNDEGFWVVSDKRDPCPWANNGWKGRAPALVYNRFPGKYQDRGAAYADRFFVYLRYSSATAPGRIPELPNSFVFESNKVLLFAIKAGIGREALTTFRSKQNFPIPADRSLPQVYRSDLLDSLADAVIKSGKRFIVAEMRVANKAVAQIFFDVSVNRHSLNLENWFSPERIVSSKPFFVGKSSFNFFAVKGDPAWKSRNFFVCFRYAGCPQDDAFWSVADARDPCAWSSKFWTGKAPALIYNTRQNSPTERTGARADQFLVYLM